jgi:hypothetical protein
MKRMLAGLLLLVGLGAGTMFAEDGYGRDRRDIRRDIRSDIRNDIRNDDAKIMHDRRELRSDLRRGNDWAAQRERRELRSEYRDVNRDRRDMFWDRR